jgi:hypothetical protein
MALTANTPLHHVRGEQSEISLLDNAIVFEGAMLGLSSGYGRPLVAGDPFLGHAAEYIDNTGGGNGGQTVTRYRGRYRLQVTLTGVAVTDVGKAVYATADDTLALAQAGSRVGVVDRFVATNTAIVEFQTADAGDKDLGGSVVILTKAGAPVDGTSGTGVGLAGPGSLCVDRTNAVLYINTGTAASPVWTVAGTQTT